MAFVELSGEEITGVICSAEDDEEVTVKMIQSCLAQSLGAYPLDKGDVQGYDEEYEMSLIKSEMAQIVQIYH